MFKVLAIARAEYLVAVRSKAFVIGVILMPVLMGGAILVQAFVDSKADTSDRKMAVLDETGELYDVLAAASEERNATAIFEEDEQTEPRFVLERVVPGEGDDGELDLELSDRVRKGELFAFLTIDEHVLDGKGEEQRIAYFTQTPTYDDLPRWTRSILEDHVVSSRFDEAGYDRETIQALNKPTNFERLGLATRGEAGEKIEAEKEDKVKNIAVPAGGMMMLFMLIMMSAPPALNNVLEEKMQKISEVLVSAVSPFQLILGKLCGTVMVATTLSVLYLGGTFVVLVHYGYESMIEPELYAWFFLFQVMAVFMYGAIFSAIGAACSEMRDAQSLMTPAMVLVLIPMFVFGAVVESPDSALSRGASLFPSATPMLMFLRIGIPPGPPMWEVLLGVVLCALATLASVWAAGKIFRIGLLSQGQAPSLAKLIGWVIRG